jgi:hypothetical protein
VTKRTTATIQRPQNASQEGVIGPYMPAVKRLGRPRETDLRAIVPWLSLDGCVSYWNIISFSKPLLLKLG